MALLIDGRQRVLAANAAARRFFSINHDRLPASLVEVTRERRVAELLRAGTPEGEARLAHHQRTVRSRLVPGPRPGETLMFLADVTDLRRLERVRQEFVANLAHELKTPLTSLRLAVESLDHDLPDEQRRRFAAQAVREADALAAVIDNLRQLADIEGGISVLKSSFRLEEVLRESIQQAGGDRPANVSIDTGLVIETDRAKLTQVLRNLLENAVKFSPPGSAIDVDVSVVESEVVLRIRDRGRGISPEHWERVFERFYKVDRARPRDSGGSGLGLAITKHLVHALGGRVWTEAATEGGQVFVVALPLRRISDP